jgi:hypothetical protein
VAAAAATRDGEAHGGATTHDKTDARLRVWTPQRSPPQCCLHLQAAPSQCSHEKPSRVACHRDPNCGSHCGRHCSTAGRGRIWSSCTRGRTVAVLERDPCRCKATSERCHIGRCLHCEAIGGSLHIGKHGHWSPRMWPRPAATIGLNHCRRTSGSAAVAQSVSAARSTDFKCSAGGSRICVRATHHWACVFAPT